MWSIDSILFWTYFALGPAGWIVFSYLIYVGRQRMSKLRRSCATVPEPSPVVSIFIPAKDEESHIHSCIDRVLSQDYSNFQVIAINDRSTDQTGLILDNLQSEKMRVVHIQSLPDGWLGKCNALHQATLGATGDWYFFVDSDVKLQPHTLTRMLAFALDRKCDALSIMTTIETGTFVERLMLPILAATWATMFAADQTNEDSQADRALANGQVFLIRAEAYRAVNGHASVRDRIVEDVELMRNLKKSGFKTRFMAGRHLASTRMHTHLSQMFHGWARIFAGTSRSRIMPMILAIIFLIGCVLSVYPSIAWGLITCDAWWTIAGVVHFMVMSLIMGLIWIWSGNAPWFGLFLPISVPIEIAILLFSIRRAKSGRVNWRGSQVDIRTTVSES